jgi:glucokinase
MSAVARPDGELLVGVDVGGSKIAVLVTDPGLTVRAWYTLPTEVGAPERAVDVIAAAIAAALVDAGTDIHSVAAVGVGVPGRVDPVAGSVSQAVNLGWQDLPLGPRLSRALGVPVSLENDVRAAALGLRERRVLGDVEDFAYLSIGTGISAGIVLDGRLRRGPRGMAGEIGHIVVDASGPPCACGLRGCLETLAAGPAIARRAAEAVARDGRSSLAAVDPLDAADVYEAAASGDPLAVRVADDVAALLAQAVHLLAMAYDLEVVAVGGGVARARDAFLDPLLRALDRLRDASPLAREVLVPGVVHLVPAADTGAWGGIALARSSAAAVMPTTVGREVGDG